ncbi:MAG: divalent cation transporter [uncultured archaeon A07HR60]|nr:MAG: divalent cation transporter [uncultured archaeon A07HR60]
METGQSGVGSWQTRSIVSHMFPLLVVLSVIVLWAGLTLEQAQQLLEEYGLLAVMVPTMVDMGGNLGAILSSRLTTRLHLGTTEFDPRDRVLLANVAAILALAATLFVGLAVGAWVVGQIIGAAIGFRELLVISVTSGMSVAVLAVVFSIVTTFGSYRLGVDPDDTTVPIVTNVVDVFGMIIFLGVSRIVLDIPV